MFWGFLISIKSQTLAYSFKHNDRSYYTSHTSLCLILHPEQRIYFFPCWLSLQLPWAALDTVSKFMQQPTYSQIVHKEHRNSHGRNFLFSSTRKKIAKEKDENKNLAPLTRYQWEKRERTYGGGMVVVGFISFFPSFSRSLEGNNNKKRKFPCFLPKWWNVVINFLFDFNAQWWGLVGCMNVIMLRKLSVFWDSIKMR